MKYKLCVGIAGVIAIAFFGVIAIKDTGTIVQSVLKPLPVLTLSIAALFRNHRTLALGLMIYSSADLALEYPTFLAKLVGIVLFAIGHFMLFLRAIFVCKKDRTFGILSLVVALPVLFATLSFGSAITQGTYHCQRGGSLNHEVFGHGFNSAIKIIIYGITVALMAMSSAAFSLIGAIGGLLFAVSDVIIIHCMACKGDCPEPTRTVCVMFLYWVGCYLVLKGTINNKKPAIVSAIIHPFIQQQPIETSTENVEIAKKID